MTNRPVLLEVPPGFEPGNEGFADLCLTTWLWHQIKNGAVDETRTRDLHLGKVALYQLSYYRMVPWGGVEPPTRRFSVYCSTS